MSKFSFVQLAFAAIAMCCGEPSNGVFFPDEVTHSGLPTGHSSVLQQPSRAGLQSPLNRQTTDGGELIFFGSENVGSPRESQPASTAAEVNIFRNEVEFGSREPSCTRMSDGISPCLNDPEYDRNVEDRFNLLMRSTNLNAVTEDAALRDILGDASLSSESDFRIPATSTRIGGELFNETPACKAAESIIYPKRAKSPSSDWVFVLNQANVQQAVKVEKCISPGHACDFGFSVPSTVQTFCRQKFIYRKMLVMDTTGSKIIPESVLMPSCCVCYIRREEIFVHSRAGSLDGFSHPDASDPSQESSLGPHSEGPVSTVGSHSTQPHPGSSPVQLHQHRDTFRTIRRIPQQNPSSFIDLITGGHYAVQNAKPVLQRSSAPVNYGHP